MIAFTFASVSVPVAELSTGAVVPVPVTNPTDAAAPSEAPWVVQLDAIQDSSDAETHAVVVAPAPATPLFWLAAASMSRFIRRPYRTSW